MSFQALCLEHDFVIIACAERVEFVSADAAITERFAIACKLNTVQACIDAFSETIGLCPQAYDRVDVATSVNNVVFLLKYLCQYYFF